MSFNNNKSVFAKILGLVFVLLALGFWSTSCTLGECESNQRELCVGAKCVCGEVCATDANCNKKDPDTSEYIQRCFAYEYTPGHGVCVHKDFLDEYGQPSKEFPNGRHLPEPSSAD